MVVSIVVEMVVIDNDVIGGNGVVLGFDLLNFGCFYIVKNYMYLSFIKYLFVFF